jgi:type I restriction enzyme M protein
MAFSITPDERRSELGQRKLRARISTLFDAVRLRYPYIFPSKTDAIELDNRSLAYIVAELQKFNFQETTSDIKGEAYEEIVSVTSRRDHGAFFTPRNVCDMAVGMAFATYPKSERVSKKILDPACGTGGFLRAALVALRVLVAEDTAMKWPGNRERAYRDTVDRLKRLCDDNIHGIDKLSELVQAAQMNLAMHGDGSSNIFHTNSLMPPGGWPADPGNNVRERVHLGEFDLVFTNPPFGSKLPVDDPQILDQFELSRFEAKNSRTSMPPEQLFIERCLSFLTPGGRMAIVLPDSILSNPGLGFIRRWVLRNAYLIASVDLPREMFARSDTHTMTSVLLLQKFTDAERMKVLESSEIPSYEIFMAIADRVGWDLRGNTVFLRTPEGAEVLQRRIRTVTSRDADGNVIEQAQEVDEPIVNDQLPSIQSLFEAWLRKIAPQPWQTPAS